MGKGKPCPLFYSTELMLINSHHETHIHLDDGIGQPIERTAVISRCIALTMENGDKLFIHLSNDAIQEIVNEAKASLAC